MRFSVSAIDLDQIVLGFALFFARPVWVPPRGRQGPLAEPIHQKAAFDGGADEMVDLQRSGHGNRAYPVQAAADRASALRTIGSAAENARFDAALEGPPNSSRTSSRKRNLPDSRAV